MPLERDDVTRSAIRLLDEVGLDGLTMRRLAADLDIQNPSLYWHLSSKQDLLNRMAEMIVIDALVDLHAPEPGQDWAEWLAGYARLLRRMTLEHRDGARLLAEADLTLNPFGDGIGLAVEVLRGAGFQPRTALASVVATLNYVLGEAFELQGDPAHGQSGSKKMSRPWMPVVDADRFPTLADLLAETDLTSSRDEWFEEGLRLLLEGMRANLRVSTL